MHRVKQHNTIKTQIKMLILLETASDGLLLSLYGKQATALGHFCHWQLFIDSSDGFSTWQQVCSGGEK